MGVALLLPFKAAVHRSRPLRFEFGDAVPMCSVWVRSVISTTAGY